MGDWFKDWFASEEYLNVYSHRNNTEAEELIEFILGEVNIKEGASVLDAACGAGRHSKILLDKGFKVTGFDLSRTLLNIANNSFNSDAVNSSFVCADLRNTCFKNKFVMVVNLFTSFGYFEDDAENAKFIKDAYNLIFENGFYVFDYLNPAFVRNNLIPFSKKQIGKKLIIERRSIKNNRVEKEITINNSTEIKKFKESVKLYSFEQVQSIFTEAGFNLYKAFGDYTGSQFNKNNSSRMLLIFKK